MMRLVAAGLLFAAAIPVGAQSPVVNALVEKRTASADFARDVQSVANRPAPAWLGYRVPIARRVDVAMQSIETCCGRCRLAPSSELVVLARVQGGSILELRPLAVDCDVDAGGMPLIWFDGVNPDASVAWLSTLVTQTGDTRPLAERALSAISQHAGTAAVTALVRFATGTSEIRGRALFWLADRAADQALPAINATLLKDPDTEMKKLAVRALSRFPNNEGVPKLMEVARSHDNADVRRQAMLQLGQSRDPRVVDFFAQLLLK